jgi:hypothetical protein
LHPIEIAVDVELEQGRGMIGGPARYFRHNAFEPSLPRSSASTNASTARTGLLSSIHSSRHSATKSTAHDPPQPRSAIDFPPQIARRIITSRTFSRSQGQNEKVSQRAFLDRCTPESGRGFAPQRTAASCRLCSLIPGFGVKLSAIILAGPTVLSAVGARPPHDGVRRRWWINVASAVSLIESSQKIGRSHHRHRPGRDVFSRRSAGTL